MPRIVPAIFAVPALLLAGGCGNSGASDDAIRGPGRAASDPLPSAAYPKIALFAGAEKRIVRTGEPTATREQGEYIVRVPLRWVGETGGTVEYQIRFLDATGLGYADHRGHSWRKVHAERGERFELVGRTFDAEAVDWECQVRLP